MAICVALGMIPVIGLVVWGMVGIFGLGSITLACLIWIKRQLSAAYANVTTPPAPPPACEPAAGYSSAPPLAAEPPIIQTVSCPSDRAEFWPRAGALGLDLAVVGGTLTLIGAMPLFPLVFMGYKAAFLAWRGATVGYIVVGLRCVRVNGEALTWQYAIARTVASILSLLPLGLGFFWAAQDPAHQTWHDKIVGTVVLKIAPLRSV